MHDFTSMLIGFAVLVTELIIIAGFVIILKKSLGIQLDISVLIQEFRQLLSLRINPESLNALFMIGLVVLSLFMIFATIIASWRKLAYFLLGSDAESIPALIMFVILLGVWLLAFILSMSFCLKHRRLMSEDT